jgi:NAD(P)-dependent dehydrogenase (short-subunit alcohol dehydrogenase family)
LAENIVFITGVSGGLGRAFAIALLDAGYRVVGTVRKAEAVAEFEAIKPGQAIARVLDVTDERSIHATVSGIEAQIGPICSLINNAGYGHEGTLEKSPMSELRQQFEVNVFGAVVVIKAVLPVMRQRRAGRIVNVTSMGGLMTMPGLSYYHGSKFALEGISASLGKEVRSFGIFVTAVEPGMFRTDWAGRSMVRSSRGIPDYDAVFEPIRAARLARSGNQPGDPAKAGRAIVQLLESPDPPAHLLLGPDALQFVGRELDHLKAEFAKWEHLSRSTNFDETSTA